MYIRVMKYKIAVILFGIIIVSMMFNTRIEPMPNEIELVISRFAETLDWVKEEPFNAYPYVVYNKGPDANYFRSDKMNKETQLQNVGRETHTYLKHIIDNYDGLADITIFLMGSVELPNKHDRAVALVREIENTRTSKFSCIKNMPSTLDTHHEFKLDNYMSSNQNNKSSNADDLIKPSDIRPFSEWHKSTFGADMKKHTCFSANAIMGVKRDDIQSRPKDFYEKLLTQVDSHHNPETGHYFERSWPEVFNLMDDQYFMF